MGPTAVGAGPRLLDVRPETARVADAVSWSRRKSAPRFSTLHPLPTARSVGPLAGTRLVQARGTAPAVAGTVPAAPSKPFRYKGVVFDMDGTLTVSNIDFDTMRERCGIPFGDLFTTMEAWPDEARIADAMALIIELERQAVETLQIMPGLRELLDYLKASGDTRVALVTRNTPASVDGFLRVLGPGYEGYFDAVITRHHRHVKPDYRLLRDLADEWGVDPRDMLMVGDSTEDVECGNGAGTATCFIEEGGNEVAAAGALGGAVPTFTVSGLPDLLSRLQDGRVSPGLGRPAPPRPWQPGFSWDQAGATAREAALESVDGELPDTGMAGAPPPGIDFLDDMYSRGVIATAESSFPRMGNAAGGMQGSPTLGHRVLHVGSGAGALTKLMASQGLQCVGIDADPGLCLRRGLMAVAFAGEALAEGSCGPAVQVGPTGGGLFDVAVVYLGPGSGGDESGAAVVKALVRDAGAVAEVASVLRPGGALCLEAVMRSEDKWALLRHVWAAGLVCEYGARLQVRGGAVGRDRVLRLVARKPGQGSEGSEGGEGGEGS